MVKLKKPSRPNRNLRINVCRILVSTFATRNLLSRPIFRQINFFNSKFRPDNIHPCAISPISPIYSSPSASKYPHILLPAMCNIVAVPIAHMVGLCQPRAHCDARVKPKDVGWPKILDADKIC